MGAKDMRGRTVWLVGLSGSGKTTISSALGEILEKRNQRVSILDGDVLRKGLCSNLGFSEAERAENIRRIAHVADLLADTGATVLIATISPLQVHRDIARAILPDQLQVFVKAPLSLCEARDPKGLYRKARAGDLPEFTGIGAPFEEPIDPDLICNTDTENLQSCVQKILLCLEEDMGSSPKNGSRSLR
jgi:adenylylsulfate kinase